MYLKDSYPDIVSLSEFAREDCGGERASQSPSRDALLWRTACRRVSRQFKAATAAKRTRRRCAWRDPPATGSLLISSRVTATNPRSGAGARSNARNAARCVRHRQSWMRCWRGRGAPAAGMPRWKSGRNPSCTRSARAVQGSFSEPRASSMGEHPRCRRSVRVWAARDARRAQHVTRRWSRIRRLSR